MAGTAVSLVGKPAWVDLATSDPAASHEFYRRVFGWKVEVDPDPQYGGYAMARVNGQDVAGIGPKMMAEAPTAWSVYIGTDDIEALTRKVTAAGGKVIVPPMAVGQQGHMAVYQDPSGAYISAWQAGAMATFTSGIPGSLGWVELNARGIDAASRFYANVFGWDAHTAPMGEGQPDYTEYYLGGGDSVAGGMEMSPMMPPEVPSYWLAYFGVADVDAAFKTAIGLGAAERVAPMDFPGGRFAVLTDPQGATFGLLRMSGAR